MPVTGRDPLVDMIIKQQIFTSMSPAMTPLTRMMVTSLVSGPWLSLSATSRHLPVRIIIIIITITIIIIHR